MQERQVPSDEKRRAPVAVCARCFSQTFLDLNQNHPQRIDLIGISRTDLRPPGNILTLPAFRCALYDHGYSKHQGGYVPILNSQNAAFALIQFAFGMFWVPRNHRYLVNPLLHTAGVVQEMAYRVLGLVSRKQTIGNSPVIQYVKAISMRS